MLHLHHTNMVLSHDQYVALMLAMITVFGILVRLYANWSTRNG